MNWKKITPKVVKSLVHNKQYLLAYVHSWGNSYAIDTWVKWNGEKQGHFMLYAMPDFISTIDSPTEVK
jgi:hypothetical protein